MHIGIAGAGIMGRLLAWQLLQQGHKISLFDNNPIEHSNACSYTAAGMLTPYAEAESAEPLVLNLGLKALSLWPKFAEQLGDIQYRTGGTLVISHQQDRGDYNRFSNALSPYFAADTALNTPSTQELGNTSTHAAARFIDSKGIAALEPELNHRFNQGIHLQDEAWVCPTSVMQSLADKLHTAGALWHANSNVCRVSPGLIEIESEGNGEIKQHIFDLAIDCRGLGAKQQLPSIRGVRGELIWVNAPDVNINRLVRLMHPRYRIYIVPRKDDIYIIGATQIESDDMSPISVRSSLELLSAAYSVHPGFAEARVLESKVNCRPALADNQPKVIHQDGLLQINGLFRHGYLLSPAIAESVCDFIQTGKISHPELYQARQRTEALA